MAGSRCLRGYVVGPRRRNGYMYGEMVMTDQPKLHAYAVACAFAAQNTGDPPSRMIVSTWLDYQPEGAAAMAMDSVHRLIAQAGQALPPLAGVTTLELTEERLSQLLTAIRTGGKGATVTPLQQVPPEKPPAQRCDHIWHRAADKSDALADGWRCGICDQVRQTPRRTGDQNWQNVWPRPDQGDPA